MTADKEPEAVPSAGALGTLEANKSQIGWTKHHWKMADDPIDIAGDGITHDYRSGSHFGQGKSV